MRSSAVTGVPSVHFRRILQLDRIGLAVFRNLCFFSREGPWFYDNVALTVIVVQVGIISSAASWDAVSDIKIGFVVTISENELNVNVPPSTG